MKTVVLCGGQGTRIRDASELLPKPMLPIGGRPIVWHIMKSYASHGLRDFVLCLGYKGWLIKEYFLNYPTITRDLEVTLGRTPTTRLLGDAPDDEEGWRITLAETGEATQTSARIAAVRRYLEGDELFMVTYGDGVSDVDLTALLRFHRAHGKAGTVTAVRPPGRFGELQTDGARVTQFNEKPQTTAGFINGGFFVFDNRRAWDFITDDPAVLLERGPLQAMAEAGELMAFEHEGFWQPMDTLREYQLLNDLWGAQRAPWKRW